MGVKRLIICRRRRKSTYLFALLFLAVVYFIFQGTSLRALQSNVPNLAGVKERQTDTESKKKNPTILGVKVDNMLHYKPDGNGMFHCIDGAAKVPMSAVNDEYCDCPTDGSDEPGTDACPNSRFYCELENKFLSSGKVNDGICDCCDGSDEWKVTLGSLKVKGFPLSDAIQHAPCTDTCSLVELKWKEQQRVRQIGLRLKMQYIAKALQVQASNGVFGEQGEYYPLSYECYDHAVDDAVYKICPWQHVEQTQNGHMFKLGKKGFWDSGRKDKPVLIMEGGDQRGCPSTPRRTEIEFTCGLSNTVTRLYEGEKCIYTVEFLTPAAC